MSSAAAVPAAFHVMVKPHGPICNLACKYCYYLEKQTLYPAGDFRMDDGLLADFIQQYIAAQQVPEIHFAWQGGEPMLMGLPFYERVVALQREFTPAGKRVSNAIQTNGTLLDDDWCRFLQRNEFLVGLSLDGPADLHDCYRRDAAGRPTFERVMAGVELLRRHQVQFNVLTCVHAGNAAHPLRVYRFLRDEVGAGFIQFIPIVKQGPTGFDPCSVTGSQYGAFLTTVFDEWISRDVGQTFVQHFDVALAAWLGQRPGLCIFEETCGTALVLEHNGDLYSCDHFVTPEWRLGNIRQDRLVDLVGAPKQIEFGGRKHALLPQECLKCEYLFACHGGCPKNRLVEGAHGGEWQNALCEGYRAFFAHIDQPMRMMAAELRAGRPASNVMFQLARQREEAQSRFDGVGRNDPCPCGSGLKYKHCCARKQKTSLTR